MEFRRIAINNYSILLESLIENTFKIEKLQNPRKVRGEMPPVYPTPVIGFQYGCSYLDSNWIAIPSTFVHV